MTALEKKYAPMIDEKKPLQLMALYAYKVLVFRAYIMVLHRYASDTQRIMPQRLRELMLSTGVTQVEYGVAIDTNSAVSPWQWYSSALHQYHTAILLFAELYAAKERPFRERIWRCLDYVFELPAGESEDEKSRMILGELGRRVTVYQSHRKVRAPESMESKVGPRPISKDIMERRPPGPGADETVGAAPITITHAESPRPNTSETGASPFSQGSAPAHFPTKYDVSSHSPLTSASQPDHTPHTASPGAIVPTEITALVGQGAAGASVDYDFSNDALSGMNDSPMMSSDTSGSRVVHAGMEPNQPILEEMQDMLDIDIDWVSALPHCPTCNYSPNCSLHHHLASAHIRIAACPRSLSTVKPNAKANDETQNEWDRLFPPDAMQMQLQNQDQPLPPDFSMPDFTFPSSQTLYASPLYHQTAGNDVGGMR